MTGVASCRRVVILGANGFLGSHLLHGLCVRGHEVFGLVRYRANLDRIVGPVHPERTGIREIDYARELEQALDAVKPSVVINAIGYGLDPGQRDLETGFQVNIRLALDICDAASKVGADMIHIGSAYEYAVSDSPLDEFSPVSPESFYGVTKASASLLLRLKSRELTTRVLIIRPFGIYGPTEASTKLIPAIISSCRDGRALDLSDGSKVRDYTYIDDVVDAFSAVLKSDTDWPSTLNIGSGRPVRIRYIADRICNILCVDGTSLRWGTLPGRKGDPANLVANASVAKALFGWHARTQLDLGLRNTIASFQFSSST